MFIWVGCSIGEVSCCVSEVIHALLLWIMQEIRSSIDTVWVGLSIDLFKDQSHNHFWACFWFLIETCQAGGLLATSGSLFLTSASLDLSLLSSLDGVGCSWGRLRQAERSSGNSGSTCNYVWMIHRTEVLHHHPCQQVTLAMADEFYFLTLIYYCTAHSLWEVIPMWCY